MKETIIKKIGCRTIFDSRGVETLEVDVETQNGFGRAAAPFGAPGSRGEFEAPAYSPEGIQGSISTAESKHLSRHSSVRMPRSGNGSTSSYTRLTARRISSAWAAIPLPWFP